MSNRKARKSLASQKRIQISLQAWGYQNKLFFNGISSYKDTDLLLFGDEVAHPQLQSNC